MTRTRASLDPAAGAPGPPAPGADEVTEAGARTAVVPTPHGDATIAVDLPAGMPRALLVLGHGAGGTVGSPDLVAVTTAAVAAGYAVVRVTQPYRVAGRKAPPRAPVLDEAWLAVLATLRVSGLPLVVGGRSSGARVACRTATAVGAAAVVTLAFPTAPPRTPEKDRLAELAAPTVPVLVVQGAGDPFGVPPDAPGRTVRVLPGATHTIRGPAARAAADAVVTWLDTVLPAPAAAATTAGSAPAAAAPAAAGSAPGAAAPAAAAPPAAGVVSPAARSGPGAGGPVRYEVARGLPGTLSVMPAPPGGPALPTALAALAADGVDVLVSLLPADQAAALDLTAEPAAATDAGLAYRALPIPDFGVPDRTAAEPTLAALAADLAAGQHVLVHCYGGVGRSGLVAAALLTRTGVPPEDAWTRVAEARGAPVPETDTQRHWLDDAAQ